MEKKSKYRKTVEMAIDHLNKFKKLMIAAAKMEDAERKRFIQRATKRQQTIFVMAGTYTEFLLFLKQNGIKTNKDQRFVHLIDENQVKGVLNSVLMKTGTWFFRWPADAVRRIEESIIAYNRCTVKMVKAGEHLGRGEVVVMKKGKAYAAKKI